MGVGYVPLRVFWRQDVLYLRSDKCVALSENTEADVIPKCTEYGLCCEHCGTCANNAKELRKVCQWAHRLDELLLLEARRFGLEADVAEVVSLMQQSSYITSKLCENLEITPEMVNKLVTEPMHKAVVKVLN